MATVENNVLIRVKDSSGNDQLFYPVTKLGNVNGLQSALDGKAASSHGTHVSYSTTAPVVAGTASAGSAATVARSDHVHPAQTSVSGNAGTASKWQTARNINGMTVQGDANRTNYGTCSTAASTAAKTVDCAGFALITGAEITVKFTVTNTADSPTLNVNGTGAKKIYYRGAAIAKSYLDASRTYTFRYDGTNYDLVGDVDTSNTYSAAGSSLGLVKSGGDVSISNGIITVNDNSHAHTIGNVTGLQTALDGKAAASHGTHVTFGTSAPAAAGTAAVGTATTVSRSDHVHPAQTSVSGNAGTATKLATARSIRTNLGSTSSASFDGSGNVTPGVTGTLGLANGGTGATTAAAGRANLGAAKIYWSANEPSDWTTNDIWFKIL